MFISPLKKDYYKENLINYYSLIFSLILVIAVVCLLSFVPNRVDMAALKEVLLPKIYDSCLPESAENLQYVAATVCFPVFILMLIPFFRKLSEKEPKSFNASAYNMVVYFPIVSIILITLLVATVSDTPFDTLIPSECINGFMWIITAVVCICLLWIGKKLSKAKIVKICYFLTSLVILVKAFAIMSTKNYMETGNSYLTHHYYAWWYPIYKVASGQTIGVDFENIYGFYPYVMYFAMKILGSVGQATVSSVLAVLTVLNGFCYFIFCYRFFKNKILGFIIALGAAFAGPLSLLVTGTYYYQYFPTRGIFPAIILAVIAIDYSTKCNKVLKRIIRIFACLILAIALFWNFETGLAATVVWAGYLILEKAFYCNLKSRELWTRVIIATASSVISVVIFVLVVEACTYFRSGELLGVSEILFGILAFAGTGFYMLPITFGVWILLVIVYVAALFCVLPKLAFTRNGKLTGDKDNFTALFVCAILGIGIFPYFVGRSYPTNVNPLFYPAIIAIGLLLELYVKDLKNVASIIKNQSKDAKSYRHILISSLLKTIICLLVICTVTSNSVFGICNMVKKDSSFNKNWAVEGNFSFEIKQSREYFHTVANNIKEWSKKYNGSNNPKLLIYWADYINELNGEKSNESVCEQIDWFYYDNVKTYLDCINSKETTAFVIDDNGQNYLNNYFSKEWDAAMEQYELKESFSIRDFKFKSNDYRYYIYTR